MFLTVLYRESYLFLAPIQDWSTPKMYAMEAIDLAPPFENKNMTKLKECVERSHVKFIGYVNRNITAYVTLFRFWANQDIYVTVLTDFMSDIERANTLIHECTHLAWCTMDLAYYGDDRYDSLSKEDQTKNADSFVEWFYPYVMQAAQRERRVWQVRTSPEAPTMQNTIPVQDSPLLRRTIV